MKLGRRKKISEKEEEEEKIGARMVDSDADGWGDKRGKCIPGRERIHLCMRGASWMGGEGENVPRGGEEGGRRASARSAGAKCSRRALAPPAGSAVPRSPLSDTVQCLPAGGASLSLPQDAGVRSARGHGGVRAGGRSKTFSCEFFLFVYFYLSFFF